MLSPTTRYLTVYITDEDPDNLGSGARVDVYDPQMDQSVRLASIGATPSSGYDYAYEVYIPNYYVGYTVVDINNMNNGEVVYFTGEDVRMNHVDVGAIANLLGLNITPNSGVNVNQLFLSIFPRMATSPRVLSPNIQPTMKR